MFLHPLEDGTAVGHKHTGRQPFKKTDLQEDFFTGKLLLGGNPFNMTPNTRTE